MAGLLDFKNRARKRHKRKIVHDGAPSRGRLDPPQALRYIGGMDRDGNKTDSAKGAAREDRLKAALKANLAKRKAQARARSENAAEDPKDKNSAR